MRTVPQMLLGMAAAGLIAGPQRPCALVAGAVAGVAPDALDWWLLHLRRKPLITVTPDPLAPDPALMIQGLRAALHHVRTEAQPCVVRFNPLPAADGTFTGYALDYDRHHRLVAKLDAPGHEAVLDEADGHIVRLALFHPLPLRVTDRPIDVLFSGSAAHIESRDLAYVTGGGHTLLAAGALTAFAMATCGWLVGVATSAALLLHLLLDAGGDCELAPWQPFAAEPVRGRRLWRDQEARANLTAATVAAVLLLAELLS